MSDTRKEIERSIRKLSVREMVALHERLIATIHEVEEAKGLEPAFKAEIERRVKSIGSAEAFEALKKM